jgi:hypothetical protein
MLDGLSHARQPMPGVASAFLAGISERPWTGFQLFALLHAAIWTALPYLLYANLPLDVIEALTYGREWRLGSDKLPPLPWWLVEAAWRTFHSDFAYYTLGQISVLLAFAAVWAMMLRVASPAAAAASVLVIDGLHFFNVTASKFNHDVVQLPFWALAGLSFHGALRTSRLGDWAVLGISIGLAFWAKYFVVVLVVPLVLFLVLDRHARHHLVTPGPYVAAAIAFAIMAPHLVWLWQNDWLPLSYVAARAKATSGFAGHLTRPLVFALAQLFWLVPVLLISLPLLRRRPHEPNAIRAGDFDRRIIALLALGPAVTLLAASALSGRALVAMWGYPLWLFLGPFIVVSVRVLIDCACMARLVLGWGIVTVLYALAFVADYAVLPYFDHRHRAVLFPGSRIAEEIAARYHAETGAPLNYVVGSMWLGGNIGHYSVDQPHTLIDGNPRRAPWVDQGDFEARGGVVVWMDDGHNAVPSDLVQTAGGAVVQPPLVLPMHRGNGAVKIGWGIIPPI